MPATKAAEAAIFQSTAAAAVPAPITPIAVCAMVLTARIPAAFSHFFVSTDTLNTQFLNILLPPDPSWIRPLHFLSPDIL